MSKKQEYEDTVVKLVFNLCKERPAMVRRIIDAASEGVKQFSDSQSDKASRYVSILSDVVDNTPGWKSLKFERKQVLESLLTAFSGTEYGEKLKKQIKKL